MGECPIFPDCSYGPDANLNTATNRTQPNSPQNTIIKIKCNQALKLQFTIYRIY